MRTFRIFTDFRFLITSKYPPPPTTKKKVFASTQSLKSVTLYIFKTFLRFCCLTAAINNELSKFPLP